MVDYKAKDKQAYATKIRDIEGIKGKAFNDTVHSAVMYLEWDQESCIKSFKRWA